MGNGPKYDSEVRRDHYNIALAKKIRLSHLLGTVNATRSSSNYKPVSINGNRQVISHRETALVVIRMLRNVAR